MINYFSYQFNWERSEFDSIEVSNSVNDKLGILGKQIISIYLEQQKGKRGITRLGKYLRSDNIINQLFNEEKVFKLVKCFENRRSFPKLFIDSIDEAITTDIYFIVLEDNFGKTSEMVDKSFVRRKDVLCFLRQLSSNFIIRNNKNIYLIEIYSFKNYSVLKDENYARLERIK